MRTKKELKEDFKQKKPRMGVFQIRNTINNKILIESSTDIDAFWNRQKFQLNNGLFPKSNLQNDWKNLGEENFMFEILSEIKADETQEIDYRREVKQLQEMFEKELQPFDNKGYNN